MDTTRPTPFISLTRNPIRAIGRAFGAGRLRFTNSRLAIINLFVLRDAGLLQQAENLRLKPDRKYDSRGELLVWIIFLDYVVDLLNFTGLGGGFKKRDYFSYRRS